MLYLWLLFYLGRVISTISRFLSVSGTSLHKMRKTNLLWGICWFVFSKFFFFWKNPTCNELWCFRLFEKNKINFVSSSAKNKCRKTKENKRNHHPKRRRRRKKAPPKINVKTCFEKQCSNVTSLSKFDTQKSNIIILGVLAHAFLWVWVLHLGLMFFLVFAFVFRFFFLIVDLFSFSFSIFHCWWNKS